MQPTDSSIVQPAAPFETTTFPNGNSHVAASNAVEQHPRIDTSATAAGSIKWLRFLFLALVILAGIYGIRQVFNRELSVETNPPGASVFVNGRLAGKTPVRIAGLPGGS